LKELKRFLGLFGYYRWFTHGYGKISTPLTSLLQKNAQYIWTETFHKLKQALTSTPVLILPDFTKPFTIEIDASVIGIGAVLMQSNHPIAT